MNVIPVQNLDQCMYNNHEYNIYEAIRKEPMNVYLQERMGKQNKKVSAHQKSSPSGCYPLQLASQADPLLAAMHHYAVKNQAISMPLVHYDDNVVYNMQLLQLPLYTNSLK